MTIGDVDEHRVGDLLRRWRSHRRLSQLALADRAEVSTRHISFIENGRSRPTRRMVARLAEHLELPPRARNEFFLAAGFAPPYTELGTEDAGIAPVMQGLRALLDAHLPWPALLLDDRWDIVDANPAVERLLAGCDPDLLEPPVNAVRVTLHPRGLAPRIGNLDEWGGHLLDRLRHRAESTHDPALAALLDEVGGYLADPGDGRRTAGRSAAHSPVVLLEIDVDGQVLRFFSVAARVEMPTDLTLEGLHLETFVPADAATHAVLGGSA